MNIQLSRLLAAGALVGSLHAQGNATADLHVVGDTLGSPATAYASGMVPNTTTYLLPSTDLSGSNYLVGLSGDPDDFLTIGLGLAQGGTFFTKNSNGAGDANFALVIPNNAAFLDMPFYLQAFSAISGTEFDAFTNYTKVTLNQSGRWQGLDSAPIPVANLAFVPNGWDSQGGISSVFVSGGGPFLLTDETTPYPTENRAWTYDTIKEQFTLLSGTMSDDRAFHNMVRLNDGRIMVIGGIQGPFGNNPYFTKVLKSCEIYDPATGAWTTVAPMGQFRAGSTASVMADGRVFVAGGTKGNGNNELFSVDDILTTSLRTTEIYNPATNSWSAGPNMFEPKAGAISTTLNNGEIMIAGGITFEIIFFIPIPGFSDTAMFYNPASNSFRSNTMRDGRALGAVTKLNNGKVLLAGGGGGDIFNIGPINQVEIYDPAANTFTRVPSLSHASAFAGAGTLPDGRAIIVGGATGDLDDPIPTADVWIYDPVANTTTLIAPMAASHGGHVTIVSGTGNVVALGGESNSGSATTASESYTW